MKDKIVIIFLAILLAGAVLRVTNLGWEPATFDEVALVLSAREYMNGNFLHNFVAFDTPPLTKYLVAIAFSLAGYSEVALRIFSALFGIGVVALTFFIARRLYGDKTALMATSITAFSILHLAFSRYAEHLVPVGFFYMAALWLLYDYAEKGNKKNFVFLGAAVALGLLAKFVMLYFIITAVIYLIIKKKINFRKSPVSISIDNYIVKAFLVFVALFLLLWPFFLYPVRVDLAVTVDQSKERNLTLSVPQGFFAFGDVSSTSVAGKRADDITNYPLGYVWLFMIKETPLFIAMFFIGLYFMLRERKRTDIFLLLSLVVFLLMLWLQNWGHTYRYFAVILPVLAIIASRWIEKTGKYFWHIFAIITILLAAAAAFYHPSYVLYYNNLNDISKISTLEAHFSEGLGEAIKDTSNCSTIYTDAANRYMLGLYINKDRILDKPDSAECVLSGMAAEIDKDFHFDINKCALTKTITAEKFNRELFRVYRCQT